jgi:hypothetical protein
MTEEQGNQILKMLQRIGWSLGLILLLLGLVIGLLVFRH